ncbi:unnamed protein product [Meloidogyne enterolobii]|uniref:Uncharacterized protein n=1 Tax=Meloidogyne enterolobii TaxID=390850 RepID=A0ACB0ZFA0_MELEN
MENDLKSFIKLPWFKKHFSNSADLEILPARYTVQYVMEEMFIYFEKRLTQIADEEPLDKLINKSFKRGEDSYLNSLLRTLFGLCETCLPSVLNVLIKWYEHQQRVSISQVGEVRDRAIKKTLVASYLFCVVLIEILLQVHFHPAECQSQINFIVGTSFNQISYKDQSVFGINYNNSLIVSEIFAEVIGVLSQTHCKLIQKYCIDNLNELRKEIPVNTHSVICLLMGMKYFRIKTNEISSLEEGIAFLEEIGSYYLEVDLKQKDLKHALAGLLVEILIPMAAQIKTEANVPALIAFVDKLYNPTYDLINKKQHKLAAYPLLTCLLCISQNKFFLSTWVQFLNLTLANLKNKDSRISRMALESLYRLIWVYTVRISCESNSVTRSRLEGICASLFPRGSRNVVPRDAPLNIFVKIIHFISQYRIDFAFREIIYDLLGCSRASSRTLSIYPERMNIGIRALMVIFDGLQQNESPPGMPRSIGFVPFGTIQRQKRSYLTQPLSIETAISLGLEQYYPACRKAFDSILRTLDAQIGRSFMLTASHVRGKEYNEVINSEMRAKLDLFRTCIAAIPRFLPDPMSHQDLIEFVIRMCVHVDEEIRLTAYQSLQNLVAECPDWREDLFHIFLRFLINQIQDTFPTLLESMVRLLLQLLSVWKLNFIEHQKNESIMLKLSTNKVGISSQSSISESCELTNSHTSFERYISATAFALHCIEGLALTLLCQLRPQIKRMAISLLYEVKGFLDCFPQKHHYETPVIEVLDEATPYVMEKYIQHVSENEKKTWHKDFASFCEIVSNVGTDPLLVNEDHGNEYLRWDVWASALSGFSEHRFLPSKCTVAISFAWPALLTRFNYCHQIIDPNNPQNENRSSLLRSSKSRYTNWPLCGDILSHENYLSLWQKYIVMVFGLFQSKTTFLSNPSLIRSFSPSCDSSEVNKSMISSVKMTRTGLLNCSQLLQKASIMIRWEATDIKDAVVLGMGSMNSECFELLFEEFNLKGILREVGERKNETNLRRKKRKDALRLQLRMFFCKN